MATTPEAQYVFEGLISCDATVPSGPEWDEFKERVKYELINNPVFEGYPVMEPDEEVSLQLIIYGLKWQVS